MFSLARPFSEADWDRINVWLDAIYGDFVAKVASGRRLSEDRVHELARGRVWSGADAVANGLADEAGGLREAVAIARRRGGRLMTPRYGSSRSLARWTSSARPSPARRRRRRAAGGIAGADVHRGLAADSRGGLPPYGPLMLPGTWRISGRRPGGRP